MTAKLALALSKAQGRIQGAKKDSTNPHFNSKYADLASIWDACREALSENEIAVVQSPEIKDGVMILKTHLLHSSGETLAGELPISVSSTATAQQVGSAITYARRYSLAAMVGVAPDDDDDGNAATQAPPKPEQKKKFDYFVPFDELMREYDGLNVNSLPGTIKEEGDFWKGEKLMFQLPQRLFSADPTEQKKWVIDALEQAIIKAKTVEKLDQLYSDNKQWIDNFELEDITEKFLLRVDHHKQFNAMKAGQK